MSAIERDAFEKFLAAVQRALPQLDGCVPVAMIFLPARPNPDGSMDVQFEGQARVIWPASYPIADRGPLLQRIAEPYVRSAVSR